MKKVTLTDSPSSGLPGDDSGDSVSSLLTADELELK